MNKTTKTAGTVYILVRDYWVGGMNRGREVVRVYAERPEIPPPIIVPGGGYWKYQVIEQNVWETYEESEGQ